MAVAGHLHTVRSGEVRAIDLGPSLTAMTEPFDPIGVLSKVLTEYGPLDDDGITERLRAAGVADPAHVLRRLHLEIGIPAG